MKKIRVMRVPEFKRIGKEAFVRKFVNRPLERYADLVYDFLLSTFNEKYGYFVLEREYKSLLLALYKLAQVLTLVSDLRDEKWLKKHYSIDDPEIVHSLTCHSSNVIIEELKRVGTAADIISFTAIDRPDIRGLVSRWESIMNLIPSEFDIKRDIDGTISDKELDDLISNVASLSEDIGKSFVRKNDSFVNSLLVIIYSYGIPLNNALYRDVYDCLELANLIPAEQLKMHKASTSRYVRENFIKQRFNRALHQTADIQ